MNILVTGSEGGIGRYLLPTLRSAGFEPRTFDVVPGEEHQYEHVIGDTRNLDAVTEAVKGIDAVVHMGGIAGDSEGQETEVFSVNVLGTWNVLWASQNAGVKRVVYLSSINALGQVGGYGQPSYLPVDDTFPHQPQTPYQLSKHLSEEMCRSFHLHYALSVICLRPVLVTNPDHYSRWQSLSNQERVALGQKDYWAYVDVRDVCHAVVLGLNAKQVANDSFLLSAHNTMAGAPTSELVKRFYPNTPWESSEEVISKRPDYALINCNRAKTILDWQPSFTWNEH